MQTLYLVQRGTINHPLVNDRLSQAVDLDYMGSAEFEFGALPRSLRALQARRADIEITVEPRITNSATASLRVLHTFTAEEYEEYLARLVELREGRLRTKESTWFDRDHADRFKTLRCDFWWDIQNHVMWTFDRRFSKTLMKCLEASWQYMDESRPRA